MSDPITKQQVSVFFLLQNLTNQKGLDMSAFTQMKCSAYFLLATTGDPPRSILIRLEICRADTTQIEVLSFIAHVLRSLSFSVAYLINTSHPLSSIDPTSTITAPQIFGECLEIFNDLVGTIESTGIATTLTDIILRQAKRN
jgi:hypothetical protein